MSDKTEINEALALLAQQSKECQYLEFSAGGVSYRAVLHREALKIERAATDALGVKVWIPFTSDGTTFKQFIVGIVKQYGQKATIA